MPNPLRTLLTATSIAISAATAEPVQLSGIYPSLAMFNDEGECGTGAVVPWAGSLWVITYAPHKPNGSSDKLYQVSGDLAQTIRPESIGGTPANRMIHKESGQLLIGPYVIDAAGKVRSIPYSRMPGRHTGNARHLFHPEGRIYYATMEEGLYELDLETLEPTELFADDQKQIRQTPAANPAAAGRRARLPGYHGKGLYSGQGRLVYANNGEPGAAAKKHPDIPSGVLAEWDGRSDDWKIIRRNQFTEVTGPGGIHGNPNPATDPIWAVGWDHKSLILGVREPAPEPSAKAWSFFRLPKGSHSYDGAHGWNTEWPRIREIGEDSLLMTMHGTFWEFPRTFTSTHSAGIRPRSNYLKVVGDFCRWKERIVLGCDDTAKSEFLNSRKAKGRIAAPQSQSNLWFIEPGRLDDLGPAIGRGMLWVNEEVPANQPSDPFLFASCDHRMLHLSHRGTVEREVVLEVDRRGNGEWTGFRRLKLPPNSYLPVVFSPEDQGVWIRLRAPNGLQGANAAFSYRNRDDRPAASADTFDGIAKPGDSLTGGLVRARAGGRKTLAFAAVDDQGRDIGYYELNARLELVASNDQAAWKHTRERAGIPADVIDVDDASVLYIDDDGKRWRLPKGDPALDHHPLGKHRVAREVATERDLFNAHGTFYELPARNAGGFIKLRPVATHNRFIHDYCSYRGLFIVSGISTEADKENPHILESSDGSTALWAGVIDDVWKLGKPRGHGGPWKDTSVRANEPSDPYLMTAYDRKSLALSADRPLTVTAQIDIEGTGNWVDYRAFQIPGNQPLTHEFPDAFSAYWIRFIPDRAATTTAQLTYR